MFRSPIRGDGCASWVAPTKRTNIPIVYKQHYMPTATARKTSTTPRKRRTRKAPVKQTPIKQVKTVTVKTPVRPTTLLKSVDYINDIKIRFDIHNYEVNALINDIKWSYNQVRDYVVSVYNREFATK